MKKLEWLANIISLTGLLACTQTNAALMDNSVHRQRTCPNGVRIYSSPSKVGAEYEEVALLNSTGLTNWTTESGMMTSMREKAAQVGATGIIIGNIDEASSGAKVAAQVFGTYTERKGKSVAIYVPGDEARIEAVCGSAKRNSVSPEATTSFKSDPLSATRAPSVAEKPTQPRLTRAPSSGNADGPQRGQATIGAPRSDRDRLAAVDAFEAAQTYLGNHEWALAEQNFQKAILFDGSRAEYHAALGSLMMTLHRWVDAEASFSAAVLLDVDNADYRRHLKEARARR